MSGGEQQMLAIARGLMSDPSMVMLDEPSLGLAPVIVDDVFDVIHNINSVKKLPVILVEQNAYMALSISNRCYVLENGRIAHSGKSSELIQSDVIRETYLGGYIQEESTMGYRYFDDQRLWDLTVEVFTRNGYSRSDCEDIANVLLASDRMGIESHGVQRMKLYTHSLEIGRIKRGAKSEIVRETPVSAVIDAHDAIGQPVSVAAMQMAIDKAKKAGVGIVVVRDSNHYGIAGYYAKMAADQGLLGISMTNTEALVVPTFGKQPMMGTNPIAVSMPGTPHPFHLDMATSVVPAGKMEVYAKAGKTLPGDWLMNSDGSPSYDPNDFLRIRATKSLGGIFPVGGEGETNSGHKGYGLSLLVELFCGILSGGRTSNEVRVVPNVDKVCHFFMAVDYSIFGDKEQMEKRFSQYLEDIRNSALADGQTRIYTHGDKAYDHMARVAEEGVKVNDKTYDEIVKICQDLGIDPAEYLIEKAGPQA